MTGTCCLQTVDQKAQLCPNQALITQRYKREIVKLHVVYFSFVFRIYWSKALNYTFHLSLMFSSLMNTCLSLNRVAPCSPFALCSVFQISQSPPCSFPHFHTDSLFFFLLPLPCTAPFATFRSHVRHLQYFLVHYMHL